MALPAGVTKLGSFRGGKGDKGDTGSLAYATAETIPAGESASVTMIGPESNRGAHFQVPRGLPGANAVENDAAVAEYVAGEDTQVHGALAAKLGVLNARTAGADMRKAADETSRTIAVTGHSLPYGQDTTGTGTNPPTNGATQTRSQYPPTDALRVQAGFLSTSAVVVLNQTYPGDRTAEALTRWASGSSGDAEFFWLDTNDANAYGPGVPLTDKETSTNLASLAARARARSAAFIVIGGMPVLDRRDSWRVFASAETERTVAERLGATYIDAGELANGAATSGLYWTDSVHLVGSVYHLIGARLAALLGPKGVNPPKVSAGRVFTWRDALWAGNAEPVAQAAPNSAGKTTRVNVGDSLGFSFWADEPVVPLVTLRASADAVVGVYTNLHIDRPPVFATVHPTGAQSVAVLGQPVTSPGPAAVVVRAESGNLDVISIEFLPVRRGAWNPDAAQISMAPVGGRGGRASSNWQARGSWESGMPLRSNASQTSRVARRWLANLTLGPHNSGLLLGPSFAPEFEYMARDGYFIIRSGSNLIVRQMNAGASTDLATVASVFPATGYVTTAIEVVHDTTAGDLLVYVDNTLRHTIPATSYKYLMAGIIAGNTLSGGYAAGTIAIA